MELRRPKQEAPTTPGYYYGRGHWQMPNDNPIPRRVIKFGDELKVGNSGIMTTMMDYEWFGPVPTCKEALT